LKISKITFSPLKSGVVIVIVKSNCGIEGLGQFIGNSFFSQKYYFEERLKKLLINQPINIEKLWKKLYWSGLGKNGWIQVISAIDIALHDLAAKKKKISLAQFLKIKNKLEIPLYWSIGHGFKKTIKEMQSKIEIGLNLGFEAFKIRMDWHELRQDINPAKDFQMLKAIRSMIPKNFYLGFDANAGYSVKVAIAQGKKFEDLGGIGHFEEPVATHNIFGLKEVVNSLDIAISFGEYEKLAIRFKEILEIANPDIIQPDLLNIGGISQMVELFKIIKNKKVNIMPHSPDIGVLCFASLHLSEKYGADMPHEFSPELYSYNMLEHAKIFNEDIIPQNGKIVLGKNVKGIGLTINKKELKKQLI
jgi:D-galactarolactone cycloisomerase|tara:strand:+ start:15154 stop:16236 length:1083 start_codon:yes stop_codon:yes gene_type:complete